MEDHLDRLEQALAEAKDLCEATRGNPSRRESIERIGELRQRYDSPKIAEVESEALSYLARHEDDPGKKEALIARIDELRRRYDKPEEEDSWQHYCATNIAYYLGCTLVHWANKVGHVPDEFDNPRRDALAAQIGELMARCDDPKDPNGGIGGYFKYYQSHHMALIYTQALLAWALASTDFQVCETLARRIGELREEFYENFIVFPEEDILYKPYSQMAVLQAKALLRVTLLELDPRRCEALAGQIGELHWSDGLSEVSLAQAQAYYRTIEIEPDPRNRETLALRIGEVASAANKHITNEIRLLHARALERAARDGP
jgi:hypothetical protein